jgi:hypothetical protein
MPLPPVPSQKDLSFLANKDLLKQAASTPLPPQNEEELKSLSDKSQD